MNEQSNLTNTTFFYEINATYRQNTRLWSNTTIIPFYAIIFLLGVVGNSLVILTLVQNQRMRTITNVFLLNLAVSDLLLGVLCMPFTLVGSLLRDFVFGQLMCKLIPFMQAASVSVSVWTLVAISVERYYAICHPLRSRRWQTLNHAYRLIAFIWILSFVCMLPIATLSQLIPTNQGHQKCRESWRSIEYERLYNLLLDVVLFVVPLLIQCITYSLITRTLWKGMQVEPGAGSSKQNNLIQVYVNSGGGSSLKRSLRVEQRTSSMVLCKLRHNVSQESTNTSNSSQRSNNNPGRARVPQLRRSNAHNSLLNKRRIIQMLFAVVLEFFICWTPLYVINTVVLFEPLLVYNTLGYTGISLFQLLAYSSSCCNPITYCFMNYGFRKSFIALFTCFDAAKHVNSAPVHVDRGVSEAESTAMVVKWP